MDILLDTSWSLHYTSTNSASYRDLFHPTTTQDRYCDRLTQYLLSQRPQYVDDLNNENEKLGAFRECKHAFSTLSDRRRTRAIQIQLIYQHATFTFILYTPHLILSKAPVSQVKIVSNFLSETFSISIDPLKLPSNLICTGLQSYVSAITSSFDDTEDLAQENRASILKSAVGTLKLTISFLGPVAPHLRTVDIGVPYETVETLQFGGQGKGFMSRLAEHVHLQTGLRLPLTSTTDDKEAMTNGRAGSVMSESISNAPLKVSKILTAAFAISVDGRLRFASKAVENALSNENIVIQADLDLLDSIVKEAKSRGTPGTD